MKARKEQPPPLQVRVQRRVLFLSTLTFPVHGLSCQYHLRRAAHQRVITTASTMDDYKTYLAEQVLSEDRIVSALTHGFTDARPHANISKGHVSDFESGIESPCQHSQTVSMVACIKGTNTQRLSGCSTNSTMSKMLNAPDPSMQPTCYMASGRTRKPTATPSKTEMCT